MSIGPILQVSNLCKNYGRFRALSDVSISVQDRTIHSIIGPNGAGKSTFVSILAGDLDLTSGSITLRGADITSLQSFQRAQLGIGRSYQHSSVFGELTVRDNIVISLMFRGRFHQFLSNALRDRHLDEAFQVLQKVGLSAAAEIKAGHLSHGEHRQLEIGMAIAQSPALLLLDEPLAGLTNSEVGKINGLIAELRNNCAVVLVEHDVASVFALSDKVTVLVAGSVLSEGDPGSVKADEGVKRHYLGEVADG